MVKIVFMFEVNKTLMKIINILILIYILNTVILDFIIIKYNISF